MDWWQLHGHQVTSTVVFSVLGMVLLGIFFAVLPRILPFSLKKEMEEDQNVAQHDLAPSEFGGHESISPSEL